MYVVKCLSGHEKEAFSGLTTPSVRSLLTTSQEKGFACGAFAWPSPVGLAVVELYCRSAIVRSIAVSRAYRRQGIGSALLQALEQELVQRGFDSVELRQLKEGQPSLALSGLLQKEGWSSLQPDGIFCQSDYPTVSQAPWMKHQRFPVHFEAFPWTGLTPQEKTALLDEQQEKPWFPASLDPFVHPERLDGLTSIGLRYRGKVVGWCIMHNAGPNRLNCTSLFVRKELQPRGHAIRLLAYTIRNTRESGTYKFLFNVGLSMQGMLDFFYNHMSSYMTAVRTLYVSTRTLAPIYPLVKVAG